MADWRDRVEDLLYAGEELIARVGRGPDEVVITSHRVLAFTPENDGANLRAIDRPNVTALTRESTGRTGLALSGAKVLAVGAMLLTGGFIIDLDGLFGSGTAESAGAVGATGIAGMLALFRTAASLTDVVLLGLGGIFSIVGAGILAFYWLTRGQSLVLEVAGGDDVRLDGDSFSQSDVAKIETALERI